MGKYVVHRLDSNQKAIQAALVKAGASVYVGGPLDLIAGYRRRTVLLEVKTARGRLRPSQIAFLASWRGHAAVVRTIDEALAEVGVIR